MPHLYADINWKIISSPKLDYTEGGKRTHPDKRARPKLRRVWCRSEPACIVGGNAKEQKFMWKIKSFLLYPSREIRDIWAQLSSIIDTPMFFQKGKSAGL
jgi:hypothetical protein